MYKSIERKKSTKLTLWMKLRYQTKTEKKNSEKLRIENILRKKLIEFSAYDSFFLLEEQKKIQNKTYNKNMFQYVFCIYLW